MERDFDCASQARPPLHLMVNQMRHHLGIGVRDAGGDTRYLSPQPIGVLDDPVMDNGEPPILAEMRMRIALADLSMRCPPGMPDSRRGESINDVVLWNATHSLDHTPSRLGRNERSPPGVVPAILHRPQRSQYHLINRHRGAHIAEYPAHHFLHIPRTAPIYHHEENRDGS